MTNDSYELALSLKRGLQLAADDQDVALKIRYVGSSASATVTVAAGGDITLKHGALGAEAADTTIKLPSGGSNGVIDVSDTDADTLAEVLDHINASPNWEAVLVCGLRTDSANDTLNALTETTLTPGTWQGLVFDTNVAFMLNVALTAFDPVTNPKELLTHARIYKATTVSTYASGTSLFQVYACSYDRTGTTLTETKIFEEANGATTVAKTWDWTAFGMKPANKDLGYRLVARIKNSAACASATLTVDGVAFEMPRG